MIHVSSVFMKRDYKMSQETSKKRVQLWLVFSEIIVTKDQYQFTYEWSRIEWYKQKETW